MRKILLGATILFMILLTCCEREKSVMQQDIEIKPENAPKESLAVQTPKVVKDITLEELFPKEKHDLLLEILGTDDYKKLGNMINRIKWQNDKPYARIETEIPGKYYCAEDNSFSILEGDNGFIYLYSPEIGYYTNDSDAMFRAPLSLKVNTSDNIETDLIKWAEELVDKYNTDEAEKLQGSIKILNTYFILDYTVGRLNEDSSPEIAVIVEHKNNQFTGSRQIYVLSKQGRDKYSVVNHNSHFVPGREEGGIYGDPYEDIIISNGVLSINHYGGSAFRWGFKHDFTYSDNELELVQMEEYSHYTGTGNGTKTLYNFRDFSLKQYATYIDGSNEKIIYSCSLTEKKYFFDDLVLGISYVELPSLECLPGLGWYEYDTGKMIKTDSKPDDVLDLVKKTYYPDLEKVNFSWTEETKNNYESICFFKVPDYFYCKDGSTLGYWKVESADSGNPQHIILYSNNDLDGQYISEFYYYDDKTGELKKQ